MAEAVRQRRILFIGLALLAPVVSALMNIRMDGVQVFFEALMILGMTGVLWPWQQKNLLQRLFSVPRALLCHRFFTWLGDVSFSVYLLHLLVVTPVTGLLLSHDHLANYGSGARYLITAGICFPIVYLLASVLHRAVEMRGIAIGKRVIQRGNKTEQALNLP